MTEMVDAYLDVALAEENWSSVCAAVERSRDPDAAVRVATAAMDRWSPWQQRRCDLPIEAWREVQEGEAVPPWLGLVRHLELDERGTLEGAERLPNLISLDVSECQTWNNGLRPELVETLPRLRFLTVGCLEDPGELAPLARLDLESLSLQDPGQSLFFSLDWLPLPPGLRELIIGPCELMTLEGVEGLIGLRRLELRDVSELSDLSALASLDGLSRLTLDRCRNVADLAPIAALAGLEHLRLTGLDEVTDITPLAELPVLADLTWNQSVAAWADADLRRAAGVLEALSMRGVVLSSFAARLIQMHGPESPE